MDRSFASGAAGSPPSAPGSPSTGYPTAGNPSTSTPATKPGPWWYHMMTEELRAVIVAAGLTPDYTATNQLALAIAKLVQIGQRSVILDGAVFAGAVTGTGKAVYWDSANSRFDLALADGSVKQNLVGFADVANSRVYAFGDTVLFSGLTPGSRYYLDGTTAGAITATMPSSGVVFIGIAKSATEIFIDIDAVPYGSLTASNIQTFTATGTLPASIVGGTAIINSASATTQTLPPANTVPAGKRIEFMNINTGVGTIARAGADAIIVSGANTTSVPCIAGDNLTLECNGSNGWYSVGGSAQLPFVSRFKVVKVTRDISLANASQAITGAGFKPSAVMAFALKDSAHQASWGFSDGTLSRVLYQQGDSTNTTYDDTLIDIHNSTGNLTQGTLASLDADGCTISWVKTGSPTGTATIGLLFFR